MDYNDRVTRIFLIGIGVLCTVIGFAGILLPLLPGTPFLLIAAACFFRSDPRLYRWLVNHPRVGKPIRDFQEKRAVSLRIKLYAVVLLWISMGMTVIFFTPQTWLKIVFLSIAAAVTLFLLFVIRTLRP